MEKLDITPIKIYNFSMSQKPSSFDELNTLLDENTLKEFIYLSSIFSASDFLQEISNVQNTQGVTAYSPFSYGKDRHVFYFCDDSEKQNISKVLKRAQNMDLKLTDYDVKDIGTKNSRGSFILTLSQDEDTQDYKPVADIKDASLMSRKLLYNEIAKLCRQGVVLNTNAIYYNNDKDVFKLLSLNDIDFGTFDSAEQRENYLNQFKDFCMV